MAVLTILLALTAGAAPGEAATPATQTVLLGLPRDETGLATALRRVSDPTSPAYRRFPGLGDVRRRHGASPAVVRAVRRHLAQAGVASRLDPSGGLLVTEMTAAQASAAVGDLAALRAAGWVAARAPEALVPALRGRVTEVVGADFSDDAAGRVVRGWATPAAPLPIRLTPRTGTPEGCAEGRDARPATGWLARLNPGTKGFTPDQIRTAHGIAPLHAAGIRGQGARVAVLEFAGGLVPGDLEGFAECFGLRAPPVRTVAIDGADPGAAATSRAARETALDVQALTAVAPGLERIDLVLAQEDTPLAAALAAALDPALGRPPDAVSISYGLCEPVLGPKRWAYGTGGRRLVDHLARVAGLIGTSVVASSGDAGASDCARAVGPVPVGSALGLVAAGAPAVNWPASSPAVTAVGATTTLLSPSDRVLSARPWNGIRNGYPGVIDVGGAAGFLAPGTGGGVSRDSPRPWYQAGLPIRGRGVPDLTAHGDPGPGMAYLCTAGATVSGGACPPNPVTGTGWTAGGGTSLSTPLVAGAVALANQAGRRQGAPPLGFLNGLLYAPAPAARAATRDLRRGTNDTLTVGCCRARAGWDAASGWGLLDATGLARAADGAWRARAR